MLVELLLTGFESKSKKLVLLLLLLLLLVSVVFVDADDEEDEVSEGTSIGALKKSSGVEVKNDARVGADEVSGGLGDGEAATPAGTEAGNTDFDVGSTEGRGVNSNVEVEAKLVSNRSFLLLTAAIERVGDCVVAVAEVEIRGDGGGNRGDLVGDAPEKTMLGLD